MNADRFRTMVLALPEATEGAHMGHPDFRVRNKIFASLTADESRAAVKCQPVNVDRLARLDPDVFRNAWGGKWLGIALAAAEANQVAELVTDAWRMTAPKTLVSQLDAEP